ncbi:recombinase family protein [Actinosynnema sp. NPDC002837]
MDAFVAAQPGWTIVRRFGDHESGSITNPPGLRKVVRAAESGQIDLLIVDRMAELSGKTPALVKLLHRLEAAGVTVRSATEPFDTSAPMGRLMVHVLAMSVEWEQDAKRRQEEAQRAFQGGERG